MVAHLLLLVRSWLQHRRTGPARRGRSCCVPTSYYTIHFCLSVFSYHRWRQCHNKRTKQYEIVDIFRVGLSLRTIPPLSSLPTAGPSSNLSSLLTVVKISIRIFFNHRDFQFENDVNSETPSVSSLYYGRRTDTSTSVPTTPTPR